MVDVDSFLAVIGLDDTTGCESPSAPAQTDERSAC